MTYNAGDRKDIRRAEKEAQVAERQRLLYLHSAMASAQGRAWFHDLLEFCRIFSDPFTGDALVEAYNKGQRNVGLKIFADILSECPDQYLTMMREANDRRTISQQPRSQNLDGGDQGSSDSAFDGDEAE